MVKTITHPEQIKANLYLEKLIDIVDDTTPKDAHTGKEFLDNTEIIDHYEQMHFPF